MSYRKWFYGLNAAMLACFVVAYGMDYSPQRKKYQRQ